ncbi:lycopene cyclase family protein [Alphaproteobacteria bacterium LSUCC0684]
MPGDRIRVGILGGGGAGLSLARRLAGMEMLDLIIVDSQKPRDRADHSWGFWHTQGMDDAFHMARKHWHRWQIITETGTADQRAERFAYAAIESKAWLTDCRLKSMKSGAEIHPYHVHAVRRTDSTFVLETDDGEITVDAVYDSRPPPLPEGIMLQHFLGWEIETEHPCFDESTAVLMDFRCDQSRGVHFIYILPYSAHRALVESTMFTPTLEENTFYENAIDRYCREILASGQYRILRREKGVIPMGVFAPRDPELPSIGGNGGAIRPSSGYAFAFIQKQADAIRACITGGEIHASTLPHQPVDLWMDRIFLRVLRRFPGIAPRLFLAIGKALNGDAMALFMAGEATWSIRLKVILAMPKWPFILALAGVGRHRHG